MTRDGGDIVSVAWAVGVSSYFPCARISGCELNKDAQILKYKLQMIQSSIPVNPGEGLPITPIEKKGSEKCAVVSEVNI